jgi:integrase
VWAECSRSACPDHEGCLEHGRSSFDSGRKRGEPLSDDAILKVLRKMQPGITVHGFRSTFKDWASEMTSFPDHVSEAALAHASGDRVRAAYARRDLFEKRRQLMNAWAKYCEPPIAAKTRRAA